MAKRPVTTLTPTLCVAARAHLGWSRKELAAAAGLSKETVRNFEQLGRPNPLRGTSLESIIAIEDALERKGYTFILEPGGEGFMWRKPR